MVLNVEHPDRIAELGDPDKITEVGAYGPRKTGCRSRGGFSSDANRLSRRSTWACTAGVLRMRIPPGTS